MEGVFLSLNLYSYFFCIYLYLFMHFFVLPQHFVNVSAFRSFDHASLQRERKGQSLIKTRFGVCICIYRYVYNYKYVVL